MRKLSKPEVFSSRNLNGRLSRLPNDPLDVVYKDELRRTILLKILRLHCDAHLRSKLQKTWFRKLGSL